MAVFQYRALQTDGALTEGRIEAGGRQEAYRQLEGRGLQPVKLSEGDDSPAKEKSGSRFSWHSTKIPFRALENFTRQLSSLLAAGVPLARALRILYREASSPAAAERWKSVHDMVVDGESLADAMSRYPDTFPRVYTAMVNAGETGGFLDLVLEQIADFQAREKELRSKVVSALVYPAVLLTLAIGVLIFLLVFFIPRFQTIFSGFGAALPLLTRIIIAASEAATQYGPVIAVVIVVGIIMVRKALLTDRGRRMWERQILRLPLIGNLLARFAMTRFCRMLGTLVGAGVPLINALHVSRRSLGNQTLVDTVSDSIERVKQGESLASSLADCHDLFPGSVLEMISVAEETGKLDKELVRLSATTETDLDRQLRTAVSLAEPLMLFLMAAFIGTIFVGMVIPIFTLQDYIK
jgi:type II secretory pathway component PulF